MKIAISFVLAATVAATHAAAGAPHDNYRPSQLRDVFLEAAHVCGPIMSTAANAKNDAFYILSPEQSKFRVRAVWTGERRSIAGETAGALTFAAKLADLNVAFFKTEIRLADGGAKYWLPVHERILDAFVRQAREGAPAELYLTLSVCGARFATVVVDDFRIAARE